MRMVRVVDKKDQFQQKMLTQLHHIRHQLIHQVVVVQVAVGHNM